jgi:hypothetical protein
LLQAARNGAERPLRQVFDFAERWRHIARHGITPTD